ncbi:MAG TPA: SGNH/GDSL hydrolase family protein, partial [Aliidongia sp.]|uniref:SGNH/GDSL hydrolase family protein n=1 Tax=Aliidongia sp. TaxID=1914230 RepID=UPI002DDD9E56
STQIDVEADQTNGTTTTLTMYVRDITAGTTPLNGATVTNTAAVLQNPAFSGVAIDATGSGSAQTMTQVQYYTDQTVNAAPAATAYTVTLATSATTLTGQAGSIATTGLTLTSPLSVTLTSTAGSSFTPNPITITSGQGTAAFTYTPAVAGSDVLAWSYSGGNVGMSGNGGQTETVTDPVFPTDANIFWSDGWWVQASGAYANNAGQYVKMAFTGASLVVNFDVTNIRTSSVTAAEWPTVRFTVDGAGITDLKLTDPGVNTYSLTLTAQLTGATTHTLMLRLLNETQAFNRWTPNGSALPPSGIKLSNFILASGASTVALSTTYLAVKPCAIYVFGDSIGEGAKTTWPNPTVTADAEATWTNAVAANQNCEYSNYAFSGQAYSGQLGVPDVPFFGSAWSLRFSGQTKLSGGHFITNSGSALPKYIVVNMGTNDAANSASKTSGAVKAVITAIRAAAPGATIFLVMPFAYHSAWFSAQGYGAYLLSEYQAYVATDSNAYLIDPGQDASVGLNNYPAGASNALSADGLHPGGQRSVNLGTTLSQLMRAALPTPTGGATGPIYYPCRRPRGPGRRRPLRRTGKAAA